MIPLIEGAVEVIATVVMGSGCIEKLDMLSQITYVNFSPTYLIRHS